MQVAAVIITYNRKELLMKCLHGVLQQSRPVDAVILVDNGSIDGTSDALHQEGYFLNGLLHYIRLEENIGSAGGFFTSLKYACEQGYDWFWLMDDDAIPKTDTLEKLLRCAGGNGSGNLGGLVSYQTAWSKASPRFRLPKSIREALLYYVACPIDISNANHPLVPVDWCTFVSLLIPRTVVRQIGFPRQEFYLYCDDIDYTIRIRKAGYLLFLVIDSLVDHQAGIEANKKTSMRRDLRWYYNYRNHVANIIIHRKEIGRLLAIASLLRISLGALRRSFLALIHKDYELSKFVLKALMDGYSLNLGKYND
jgi:rhamnopyranosyl-N-acetylglucosaminyl-diphospho-decaprenol beta-1,3/1,4-galactofuranosyltransferase